MWSEVRDIKGENPNVTKFVFLKKDAVAEAVLYKYGDCRDRTVICCSTQSGCPVGCAFCGTGKKFVRNLTAREITSQIETVLQSKHVDCSVDDIFRFQIMFMSMGEPFLNMKNVITAIRDMNEEYVDVELLVSTMGAKSATFEQDLKSFTEQSRLISGVGLQFSIHKMIDSDRDRLIPFKNKLTLREMRDVGIFWHKQTKRPVFLNFCVDEEWSAYERARLLDMFSPVVFNLTFSVVCNTEKGGLSSRGIETAKKMNDEFTAIGYNSRTFDPGGQDDIGAGCGQLWFVQDWMKNRGE